MTINTLAVIPARSGSRRVPHKNIRPLRGKPLMVYTIEQALAYKEIDHVVVSTDDETYADIAQQAGAEILFRPPELAEDVDTGLVVQHAYEYYRENFNFDAVWIITLQPTSPFRTTEDIDYTYCGVFGGGGSQIATGISVTPVSEHPAWMFRMEKEGVCSVDDGYNVLRSFLGYPLRLLSGVIAQDLPELVIPNGAIYVTHQEIIQQGRIYGDLLIPYVMPPERSIDIEEEIDFRIAEIIMEMQNVV